MRRFGKAVAISAFSLVGLLSWTDSASGSTGPRWSVAQLASYSDVIVSARVAAETSGWDPVVNAIYTYVAVDVSEVFKGAVATERVTIKQLGGAAGAVGLFVADQPTFHPGEDVLLFLEARPRDATLYTSGMSQGKWTIVARPDGERVAIRGTEILALGSLRLVAAATAVFDRHIAVETRPIDAASSHPVTLMATPYLYTFFPPVDMQAGGQPGLPGGGLTEVQTAIGRWSGAGSSFRYVTGGQSQARCTGQFLGTYRVTITFLDPCGEISNSGGTVAIGGSYYTTAPAVSVNGRSFRLALEGFIINNDSRVALDFLGVSGCFEDVQLHELGHVLGLGHSADNTAIMFPTVRTGCLSAPHGLGADDVRGIQYIYPAIEDAPGPSIVSRASASGEVLTIEWFAGPGAAPTSHRLDFFSAGSLIVSVLVGPDTRVALPLATGIHGTFSVTVTPFSGVTAGPSSSAFPFSIGLACNGPPAAPAVSGGVLAGTATVMWGSVEGATHYVVQAGSTRGGDDVAAATNVGAATTVSAGGLPPGFSAWVSVSAVNACGQSAPGDVLVR